MKARMMQITLAVAIGLLLAVPCFAAQSNTIQVKATVPAEDAFWDIGISRIVPADPLAAPGSDASIDRWTPNQSSIDFGILTLHPKYLIFMADCYYAMDIGVMDNTGQVWSINLSAASVVMPGTSNRWTLDENINVVVMKQADDTHGTEIAKMSYASSNGWSIRTNQLGEGWLRIYYGIANGKTDAGGVGPITGVYRPGTYSGTVTLTLTK